MHTRGPIIRLPTHIHTHTCTKCLPVIYTCVVARSDNVFNSKFLFNFVFANVTNTGFQSDVCYQTTGPITYLDLPDHRWNTQWNRDIVCTGVSRRGSSVDTVRTNGICQTFPLNFQRVFHWSCFNVAQDISALIRSPRLWNQLELKVASCNTLQTRTHLPPLLSEYKDSCLPIEND